MAQDIQSLYFYVFRFDNQVLLFDTNRVKVFNSSEAEAGLLEKNNSRSDHYQPFIDTYGEDTVNSALERLNRLSRLSASLANIGGGPDEANMDMTTLWLNVTHTCNLKCRYCYARKGAYEEGAKIMSQDMARAGTDFFLGLPRLHNICILVFAGGEPLLNFPTIRAAVIHALEQARSTNTVYLFRILTNGTIMTPEILDFLSEYRVGLQISMDGPPEIHDCNRQTKEGKGSFRKVSETIAFLKSNNFNQFSIRSTLCHQGPDVSELERFLHQEGFRDFALRPIMTESESPLRLNSREIRDFGQFYLDQGKKTVSAIQNGQPVQVPEDLHTYVERLKFGWKSKRYCGAGHSMLVMTPGGDFYPCPSLVSIPEFRTGSLRAGLFESIIHRFSANTIDHKKQCCTCWARNLCGGACAAQAWGVNRDIAVPDPAECEIIKARIAGAMYIYDKIRERSMPCGSGYQGM